MFRKSIPTLKLNYNNVPIYRIFDLIPKLRYNENGYIAIKDC